MMNLVMPYSVIILVIKVNKDQPHNEQKHHNFSISGMGIHDIVA